MLSFDPKKLVFIDETGAKTNMTRRYGRALRGKRLVDRVPHGHWVNTTMVGALRQSGMTAVCVFDGAMNKDRLESYVRDVLCTTLRKGDIVVWDNLPAHKSSVAKALIESRGASLLALPPYSPDLNPIENAFSKLKARLRKEAIRDVGKLRDFLQQAEKLFSKAECKNYIRHAGYGTQ